MIANLRKVVALAGILLVPGLATLWTAWEKLMAPMPPAPLPLSLTGLGALAINLSCAFMLARSRAHSGRLTRAPAENTGLPRIGRERVAAPARSLELRSAYQSSKRLLSAVLTSLEGDWAR